MRSFIAGATGQSPRSADRSLAECALLTSSTRLRRPSVAVSIRPLAPFLIRNPGSGTRGSTVSSKRTLVRIVLGSQPVAGFLRTLLFGADQCPAHAVVVHRVGEHLLIADANNFDDLPRFAWAALVVSLEDFDLLMGRGPLGQRLKVEQYFHDLVGRCLDEDFTGLGDSHAATSPESPDEQGRIAAFYAVGDCKCDRIRRCRRCGMNSSDSRTISAAGICRSESST